MSLEAKVLIEEWAFIRRTPYDVWLVDGYGGITEPVTGLLQAGDRVFVADINIDCRNPGSDPAIFLIFEPITGLYFEMEDWLGNVTTKTS